MNEARSSALVESEVETLALKQRENIVEERVMSLAKLPPGEYTCQVTVLDPNDQKAAFWQAPVLLIP